MLAPRTHCASARFARPACLAAILTLGLAGIKPAQAVTTWDEVTFYLTYASYTPGDNVSTTFTFGTKPAIDLSAFEFTLSWDNVLATPLSSGPGSVEDWASALSLKGSVDYGFTAPQVIKGSWTADPLGGSASFISTSYDDPVRTVFTFETSSALETPFVVSIELTNIKDAAGDTVDTGSGFINWATMTPVPEPAHWLGLMSGVAILACLRRLQAPAGRA